MYYCRATNLHKHKKMYSLIQNIFLLNGKLTNFIHQEFRSRESPSQEAEQQP